MVADSPIRLGTLNGIDYQQNRVCSPDGKSVSLNGNGGGGANTGLYAVGAALRTRNGGKMLETGGKKANSLTTVQTDSLVAQYEKCMIRKLTPTECERLQTFPDGWTEGVSNTQRYKQLGNAVCVEVVKHIFENLKSKEKN